MIHSALFAVGLTDHLPEVTVPPTREAGQLAVPP